VKQPQTSTKAELKGNRTSHSEVLLCPPPLKKTKQKKNGNELLCWFFYISQYLPFIFLIFFFIFVISDRLQAKMPWSKHSLIIIITAALFGLRASG